MIHHPPRATGRYRGRLRHLGAMTWAQRHTGSLSRPRIFLRAPSRLTASHSQIFISFHPSIPTMRDVRARRGRARDLICPPLRALKSAVPSSAGSTSSSCASRPMGPGAASSDFQVCWLANMPFLFVLPIYSFKHSLLFFINLFARMK